MSRPLGVQDPTLLIAWLLFVMDKVSCWPELGQCFLSQQVKPSLEFTLIKPRHMLNAHAGHFGSNDCKIPTSSAGSPLSHRLLR